MDMTLPNVFSGDAVGGFESNNKASVNQLSVCGIMEQACGDLSWG
jgi:hypothetical protein